MANPPNQRKRVFVNGRIQGAVLLRFAGYWMIYHFVLWHTLFLFHFLQYRVALLNGGSVESFSDLYWDFCTKYYPMLLAAIGILPIFLYDSICTTHRIAGPLVRFRNTLRQLRQGERVDSVRLREGDLLIEFQDEFNKFLTFYNAQREHTVPRTAGDDESELLEQTQQLLENVQSASACDEPWHQQEAPLA